MNLEGKRVLISGGSSRADLAIAQALLAKGAQVVVAERGTDAFAGAVDQLRKGGEHVEGIAADVATEEGRRTTLQRATEILTGLDVLINNASDIETRRLDETSAAEIQATAQIDLLAPILLIWAALPSLRASGSDALVVNVSSSLAPAAAPINVTYAAMRAGLASFGEELREELKSTGIRLLTVYRHGTEPRVTQSDHADPDLGYLDESASALAGAVVNGIESDLPEVFFVSG